MQTTYKPSRARSRVPTARFGRLPLAVAIYFAIGTAAFAQDSGQAPAQGTAPSPADTAATKQAKVLDTITVTAQKRRENPQKVPISLTVLGDEKLKELNVKSFDDYVKYLPTVSYEDDGPGDAQIYMRGVANGSNGNHSGPQPSVGVYLDEEPITTIDGPLDLHIYDVARVESLAGPQGTLYGASSQSGTLRIITNKPDPKAFSASYSVESDTVANGGVGHVVEGYVNVPFNDRTAIRVVAWDKHDAGYIDNALGTRTYPTWGGTISNGDCTSTPTFICTSKAKDNYNTVDTDGVRAALQFNLNDNWTITPSVINQKTSAKGDFAFDPNVGDLKLTHFYPEDSTDNWTQSALTVQGKIGSFDVTYAFAHLNRNERADSDYSDYSFWYDTVAGYGAYWYDNNGNPINPSQYIQSVDNFRKTSHELRIATPADWRLSFVGGFFWERQSHDIQQDYRINGLADSLSVTGWPDTIWLTKQLRVDRDEALFGELSYQFNDQWRLTGGLREFKVDNTLEGFYGFAEGYSSQSNRPPSARYGEAGCIVKYGPDPSTWPKFEGAPCFLFHGDVRETNNVGKLNLTYQINPKDMVYATWSQGFRPGGDNRNFGLGPYVSDYLDNYELGWKTTWMDNRLRWNGAIFDEQWKNFQFGFIPPGSAGLTVIRNAPQAEIRGLETNIDWKATDNLTISGGVAFYNAKLTADYCGQVDPVTDVPDTFCPAGITLPNGNMYPDGPAAPKGTQLPITPKVKADLVARYNFEVGGMDAYVQGAAVHVGRRTSALEVTDSTLQGDLPAYTSVDFSAGIKKNHWAIDAFLQNAFDSRGEVSKFTECATEVCAIAPGSSSVYPFNGNEPGRVYVVPIQPRTFGLRFTQDFE
ncbi:MAG TPA: TonB-dependent receptor [Xanthomonadaceae bacterium]|jgi:outer membrane receptor protein involved in Fe transport